MRNVIISMCMAAVTWAVPVELDAQDNWPSHRGPNGNYHLSSESNYPVAWSVATQENIRWRKPLPETGHSGIAAWGDKLFLTCFQELTDADNRRGRKERLETWASRTRGYCVSAETGEILWSHDLPGERPNQVNGVFTDSTTPTPVTDGKHVWFVNAGGFMACCTVDGDLVWEKAFEVRTKHSAKQFQPFLHRGKLYYAMLRDKNDPSRRKQTAIDWDKNSKEGWPWMFVRCFDAATGQPMRVLPEGICCHSKGALGQVDGEMVLLHGRGGSHFPPEEPYGLGLSTLGETNRLLWSNPRAGLEGTHFVDQKYAYSFNKSGLQVLSLKSGATIKQIRIPDHAVATLFDEVSDRYQAGKRVSTRKWKRTLTHHASIGVGDYHFFMTGTPGWLGRIDIATAEVRFLQVPLQVDLENGKRTFSWTEFEAGDETESGFKVVGDGRRLGHGFGHVTAATPIVVNHRVYFTTMLGTVYVIDATARVFDQNALLAVNDLGLPGKTWTLSPLTAAGGRLYQRTSRELVCIGDGSNGRLPGHARHR